MSLIKGVSGMAFGGVKLGFNTVRKGPMGFFKGTFVEGAKSLKAGLGGKSLSSAAVMKGIALTSMGTLGTTAMMKAIGRSKQRQNSTVNGHRNTMMRRHSNLQF